MGGLGSRGAWETSGGLESTQSNSPIGIQKEQAKAKGRGCRSRVGPQSSQARDGRGQLAEGLPQIPQKRKLLKHKALPQWSAFLFYLMAFLSIEHWALNITHFLITPLPTVPLSAANSSFIILPSLFLVQYSLPAFLCAKPLLCVLCASAWNSAVQANYPPLSALVLCPSDHVCRTSLAGSKSWAYTHACAAVHGGKWFDPIGIRRDNL